MDRFRICSKRLLLPLVGLTSVGLLWVALPGRPNPSHPAGRGPDIRAETVLAKRAEPNGPPAPAPVQLQPVENKAWLPPIHQRTRAVLTTALAGGAIDREVAWPDGPASLRSGPMAADPGDRPIPTPSGKSISAGQSGKIEQPAPSEAAPLPPTHRPVMVPVVDAKRRQESKPGVAPQSPRVLQDALRVEPSAASATAARSRQLESIAQEADRHSRQGYELAGRGAYYAARSELIAALRLVAQGLDAEQQTTIHGRALSAGLAAIRESQDFLPPRDRVESDVKVAEIVARHQTPVLKGTAEGVSAVEALKCYFTFAQEQLAAAVGTEIAGSMALHGLGKLHSALAERKEARMPAAESKAMAFYQAALLVAPRNYMASNDLGVLLARSGYYAEARLALEHSVSVHAQAAGWQNLAQVYRRLGDNARAVRAESLFQVAQRAEAAARKQTAAGQVQWVDPQAFAQSFAQTPAAHEPLSVRQPAGAAKEGSADKPVAARPFGTLFQKRQ